MKTEFVNSELEVIRFAEKDIIMTSHGTLCETEEEESQGCLGFVFEGD